MRSSNGQVHRRGTSTSPFVAGALAMALATGFGLFPSRSRTLRLCATAASNSSAASNDGVGLVQRFRVRAEVQGYAFILCGLPWGLRFRGECSRFDKGHSPPLQLPPLPLPPPPLPIFLPVSTDGSLRVQESKALGLSRGLG